MAFVRKVRTASGATAVQIAEYAGGRRQRIVAHLGSAHTSAELGVLLERARAMLEDPAQGVLDIDAQPELAVGDLVDAPAAEQPLFAEPAPARTRRRDSAGRVVGTASQALFDAVAGVYDGLGFDALGDAVFGGSGGGAGGGADVAARHRTRAD